MSSKEGKIKYTELAAGALRSSSGVLEGTGFCVAVSAQ